MIATNCESLIDYEFRVESLKKGIDRIIRYCQILTS